MTIVHGICGINGYNDRNDIKTGVRVVNILKFKGLSGLILGLVTLGLSGSLAAAELAGTVIALKGQVTAAMPSSEARTLAKNAHIFVSDEVRTRPGSYAVIEFVDGARATIRPDSKVVVKEYAFNTSDDSALLDLVKGGLRCITGGIAKKRPESFRVKAGVATLGVRGTEFSLRICEDDCAEEELRFADGRLAGHGVELLSAK